MGSRQVNLGHIHREVGAGGGAVAIGGARPTTQGPADYGKGFHLYSKIDGKPLTCFK